MKLYEKVGIDLTTQEGLFKAMNFCPKESEIYPYAGCPINECGRIIDCSICTSEYLMKDTITKIVKRYETYNGDFGKAVLDFEKSEIVKKSTLDKYSPSTFAEWLMEEIEVEE